MAIVANYVFRNLLEWGQGTLTFSLQSTGGKSHLHWKLSVAESSVKKLTLKR